MQKLMNNPRTRERVCERVCRICMQKSKLLEGHGCNLEDFAPTEEAPEEEEHVERQYSPPRPEVEMVEEFGGSHRPKSPTNDLLDQQVEEMLNKSKSLPQKKLEVKVENVRRSR